MAITRNKKHNNCEVMTVKLKSNNRHYAQLICKKHKEYIQWLSVQDFNEISKIPYFKEHIQWLSVQDFNEINKIPKAIGRSGPSDTDSGTKERSLRLGQEEKRLGNTQRTEYQFVQ